jgi:hypothetical protein
MSITYFSNSCDVLGETHAMINVESLVILQVLYYFWCIEIDKDCVLLHLETIHLNKRATVLLQVLERF